jgi:hypothetical protein
MPTATDECATSARPVPDHEVVHLVCCSWSEHPPPYVACCGADCTDEDDTPTGGQDCVMCVEVDRQWAGGFCPRTGGLCDQYEEDLCRT